MSDRWFRTLLRLVPQSFRREYGEQMLDVFREARDGARLDTFRGRLGFRFHIVRDTVATASNQTRPEHLWIVRGCWCPPVLKLLRLRASRTRERR